MSLVDCATWPSADQSNLPINNQVSVQTYGSPQWSQVHEHPMVTSSKGLERHAHYHCTEDGCNEIFISDQQLALHAKATKHRAFKCRLENCSQTFFDPRHRKGHEAHSHVQEHYQIEGSIPLACIECGEVLSNRARLQAHANEKSHSPFQCACRMKFARVDVLHRYIDSYSSDMLKHPCKICKLHRGRRGFKRRDHLVQHLRGYHKFDAEEVSRMPSSQDNYRRGFSAIDIKWRICPHVGCEHHRGPSFHDLNRWKKEVHDETPHPCDVPGCDRRGASGYMRQKDLMKHRAAKHPELEQPFEAAQPSDGTSA
ncbi:hypothetical protein BKA67DRAFT_531525 [Truncatella angustata]|uniref:C2H2-type domain-containing protein n=1 Tax=Truncatella angustata TaxID=152316 RepID=A0A9P9A0R1_9PEZI|nr:uncharacterized protein BKA67DRAFT_531525 [Truncatella angustata]KAH6656240.1 hypothetical protein BKA67DRAFT_531525 [Truncatella angustata]